MTHSHIGNTWKTTLRKTDKTSGDAAKYSIRAILLDMIALRKRRYRSILGSAGQPKTKCGIDSSVQV
jgi:hypothetical protein